MKYLMYLLFMFFLPTVANADAVEIDGIYYNLISKAKEAEVTSGKDRYSGAINIPKTVVYDGQTYYVTKICPKAFYWCTSLTSVSIPSSVKSIGEDAFDNCKSLESVYISDVVAWCNISFADNFSNPLYYAHHLYMEGEEIKELVISNSITTIRHNAFQGCSGLTSVIIPNSVTTIESGAFYGCSGLTSITIPSSVTDIEGSEYRINTYGAYKTCGAFEGCSGLTSVIIPNSITRIDDCVFAGCSSLTSVTIPNSVTVIGAGAFSGCGLESITIPNSVTYIGNGYQTYSGSQNGAFEDCKNLTSVSIPSSITSIPGHLFARCANLKSIMIPNSVTSIGGGAFWRCSSLTSIVIPNSVKTIEGGQRDTRGNSYGAFEDCNNLTSLTIGTNIEKIDRYAFASDQKLADVFCLADKMPETSSLVFDNSYIEYATLYVPGASIEVYRAVEPWKNFKSIVALDGSEVSEPNKCATPTISFANGELEFSCETEGVEYVSEVTVSDAKKNYTNKVSLTGIYKVSVYAMKTGWDNSDVATLEFTLDSNGENCDVNKDGKVDVADIATIISEMAARARKQNEMEE